MKALDVFSVSILSLLTLSSVALASRPGQFPGKCYLETEYPVGPVQVNELTPSQSESHTLTYEYAGVTARVVIGQFDGQDRPTTELDFTFFDTATGITYESKAFVEVSNIPGGSFLGQLTVGRNPKTQMSYNLSCERE